MSDSLVSFYGPLCIIVCSCDFYVMILDFRLGIEPSKVTPVQLARLSLVYRVSKSVFE